MGTVMRGWVPSRGRTGDGRTSGLVTGGPAWEEARGAFSPGPSLNLFPTSNRGL